MESPSISFIPESATYSQVVFTDIPQSYPPKTPITCHYTVTAGLQPNPRDWVGICKVGWSTTKDYHTFVWVEPSLDVVGQDSVRKQVFFREYYLPKDETEFYQFCYVDSKGQVKGVSTPFSFNAAGQLSQDCCQEDDLLVITTQDEVEESEREKDELVKELEREKKLNETIKDELEKKQREIEQLKKLAQNVTMLEQQQNNATEMWDLTQSTKSLDESQKRQKVSQLKQERDELRREIEEQSAEIIQLKRKAKESEQELLRTKDHIQLQQVDLQTSENEKEGLRAELHKLHDLKDDLGKLTQEKQGLLRTLSERESMLAMADGDLKVQYQTVLKQLEDMQAQLQRMTQVAVNARRQADEIDKELQGAMECLEKKSIEVTLEKQKIHKLEMQLSELYTQLEEKVDMAEIAKAETVELTRENLELKKDIERLRTELAVLQAAPAPVSLQHSNPYSQTSDLTTTNEQQQELSDSLTYGNPYEDLGSATDLEEESLECHHCKEKFPGITQEELEQHEQSHRVCPFCTLLCDHMEQGVFEDHVYSHEV